MVTSWQSECVLVLALSYSALIDRY
jgi:hypothetical protein